MSVGVSVAKRINSLPSGAVTATVAVMDYMLVFTIALTVALFLIGFMLVSFPVGLFMALLGSVLALFAYVGFCQIFADHRGARHV